MSSTPFTASHAPLIRNYLVSPPTSVAPPVDPTIQPPSDGMAFSVSGSAETYGEEGEAFAEDLATVTCADDAMTIVKSAMPPGLTLSFDGTVLSASGTPTSPGVFRVTVHYIASDGSNSVRGSSTHTFVIISTTAVLTIGSQANLTATLGDTVSLTLCSPTIDSNIGVFASPLASILVEDGASSRQGISLAWTQGATSSGVLTVAGVVSAANTPGSFTLRVNYYSRTATPILLGFSEHLVTINARYTAPAPAPAPVPAPPPAPVPVPAPTPTTPLGNTGADALISSVRLLNHFNTATTDNPGRTKTVTAGADGNLTLDGKITAITDLKSSTLGTTIPLSAVTFSGSRVTFTTPRPAGLSYYVAYQVERAASFAGTIGPALVGDGGISAGIVSNAAQLYPVLQDATTAPTVQPTGLGLGAAYSVSAEFDGGGQAYLWLRVWPDGTWTITSDAQGGTILSLSGSPMSGVWHPFPAAGIGAGHEIRFVTSVISGPPPIASTATTWTSLASMRSVIVSDNGAANVSVEIRTVGAASVVSSFTVFTVATTNLNPGGA